MTAKKNQYIYLSNGTVQGHQQLITKSCSAHTRIL